VRHCTISKTPTDKFFVSILCEVGHEPLKPVNKQVGIDLGIKDFVVTSEGIRFENNHYLKKYEKKLAKAQRHLSRKKIGSNGRRRQRLKVSEIHEKIANTRHDLLHKISTRIANEYDTMCGGPEC
jgi:putative transposase